MTRWAMVADLERCVGCQTCTAACRHSNATSPAVQWRKVLDVEAGAYPNVSRTFVPVGCQHCADPPCMHVCPSTATRQRADGIVTIDYDICIGCAYCDVACPYQARFKVDAPRLAYANVAMYNEIQREEPRRVGVAQKCTFCSDRVDFGLANGLSVGLDPRATPACVNACIADALHFGDLDDPNSNVSKLLNSHRRFRMHEELGTEPGFYYLYGAATAPQLENPAPTARQGPVALRTKGVAPWHQQHWDWKAAANFVCGGAGAGLFTIAAIWTRVPLFPLGLVALALVALGLFCVLMKIGRPRRFMYVLRQPRRSWMAREAWIACALFPVGLAATWFDASVLRLAGAAVALAYLFSQAMILQAARGIPAWRTPLMSPLIVATGIAEGSALLLVAAALWTPLQPARAAVMMVAVVTAALRAGIWYAYLAALRREGAPWRSLAVLEAFGPWFFAFGLALPLGAIVAGLLITAATPILFALAGAAIAAAGAALKFLLVTRAGYNQGFALTHTPVRGSGIAGPAVKPGWT